MFSSEGRRKKEEEEDARHQPVSQAGSMQSASTNQRLQPSLNRKGEKPVLPGSRSIGQPEVSAKKNRHIQRNVRPAAPFLPFSCMLVCWNQDLESFSLHSARSFSYPSKWMELMR